MWAKSGLRRRILFGLFGYTALLSLALVIQGFVVNEYAERLVWQSLLEYELDRFEEGTRRDPDYRWIDIPAVRLFEGRDPKQPLPPELRNLAPGLHDDIFVEGRARAVLIREVDGKPITLMLDITEFERRESDMTLTVAGFAITMVLLLGFAIAWAVSRLLAPLSNMALRIGGLEPDRIGQRIEVPESASAELVTIADAFNDYLKRNEGFVERERAFVDSVSHELRTPVAVIAGASELALSQRDVPQAARNQLIRIERTVHDVEQLISLLLTLAKEPARLGSISERVVLDELLPEIVENHRHLTRDKDLELVLAPMPRCETVAPLQIVRAAIGNLLRNAIENSDRGKIVIKLKPDATVVIEDPGHGMSPEEISAIYARMARGGHREGGGIGLELISRLCDHLQWQLRFSPGQQLGTITTLKLRPSPLAE